MCLLAKLATQAGVPDGVLNVVHGEGRRRRARGRPAREEGVLHQRCGLGATGRGPRRPGSQAERLRARWQGRRHLLSRRHRRPGGRRCRDGDLRRLPTSIADELVSRVAARAKTIRFGDPRDPQTEIGPMSQADANGSRSRTRRLRPFGERACDLPIIAPVSPVQR
ncbi:aldehyde dehydrogenase family protein [Amycolatopsis sp. DSM 110486]|nr:aldehyde dehydrogenase family protein [Amycolatopsis sp. DSM 110486]